MSFLIEFFNVFFYQPLFNFLIVIYKYISFGDFGIAVIILTILVKFILYPLNVKAIKSQKVFSELQPKIKEIQNKYKDDKEKQAKELMEVYKGAKVSPFAGFSSMLIQLPVLIALYQLFWQGLNPEQMRFLYSFVSFEGAINPDFLSILNLSKSNIYLAASAGILQYLQVKTMGPKSKSSLKSQSDFAKILQTQMQYFFPFFTVIILLNMPSAIALYFLTSSVFSIIQQYFVLKKEKTA